MAAPFFFCYFVPPSLPLVVSFSFFFTLSFQHLFPSHVEGSEGRAGTLFLSAALRGGSCPPFLFLSFFLSSPPSLYSSLPFAPSSLRLLWQALLEFSPHGSGRKSMPICVFSCSSLYWWRLEKRKRDRWGEKINKIQRLLNAARWLDTNYS